MSSCSDEKEQPGVSSTRDTLANHRTTRLREQSQKNFEPVYDKLNPEVGHFILSLDSMYARTPYYTRLNDRWAFMVCKGIWVAPNDTFKNAHGLLGLVSENGEVLLEPEYHKIYSPDLTARDYIEIEKGGKRGLYNYVLKALIPAQFDVIFPSADMKYSAVAKKGTLYFGIQGAQVLPYEGAVPTYNDHWHQWKFNAMSDVTYWYDSYATFYEGDPEEGTGVVFTPSYLHDLGFLPEVVSWIAEDAKHDFGIVESKGSVVESHSVSERIFALITSFYEEGVDGRGWETERKHIATVDENNNVIGKQVFLNEPYVGTYHHCGKDAVGFNYRDDNLLEVRNLVSGNRYAAYDDMTVYEYYKIDDQGRIKKLNSVRIFDFTKYVRITDEHFKGCFAKHLDDIIQVDEEEGNMWLSEHLAMEDLDLMRNEIYAEYGLKFKTEKWQKYFAQQGWYKPLHDNVDHLLTETDKHNLKVITAMQARMKEHEDEITGRHLYMYSAAG